MKTTGIFKEIFSLAVRLVGLYFLYVGLKDLEVPALMDLTIIRVEKVDDVISTILPVVFSMAVAWWLLGSKLLTWRAYPETTRIVAPSHSPAEPPAPAPSRAPSHELTAMEIAERKLAALVGKTG